MDIEEAKEYLRIKIKKKKEQIENGELWLDTLVEGEKKDITAIETVLSELEKRDKIIDEMADYMNLLSNELIAETGINDLKFCELEACTNNPEIECEDCIKDYFTNKVEKEGK